MVLRGKNTTQRRLDAAIWLHQAKGDLEVAKLLLSQERHDWACVVAQQAAEKAVKGARVALGFKQVDTHVIPALINDCPRLKKGLFASRTELLVLTNLYTRARCPDVRSGSAPRDLLTLRHSGDATKTASAVVSFCETLINRKPAR